MKLLVTGPRGFIASHFIRSLHEVEGHQVSTLDRDFPKADLVDFFARNQFDCVIHLATLFLKTHDFEAIDPLIESNLLLTTRLLEASKLSGVKHFIGFGSYYQFPKAASLYAATKSAMEPIFEYYAGDGNLRITELFLYDTYGPADVRPKITNLLIEAARSGKEMLLSPGFQKMKLLHVEDVCSAIRHCLSFSPKTAGSHPSVERFAIEPTEARTLREITAQIELILGQKINAQWGARDYVAGVQMDPHLPFPSLPDWKAHIPLEQGLVEVIKSC